MSGDVPIPGPVPVPGLPPVPALSPNPELPPKPGPPPVDWTEELLRAMLDRRASKPVPDWLEARTMQAFAASPQTRTGDSGRSADRRPRPDRLVAAALAGILALGVLGAGILAAGLPGSLSSPSPASGMADGPPLATPAGEASAGPSLPSGSATPPMTGEEQFLGPLGPDTLAVVTPDGGPLRVRLAPGLSSEAVTPALPTGTRLLVLGGPVAADGYDWYEILTGGKDWNEAIEDTVNIRRYGWVAAADLDGATWIKPTGPRCWPSLNAAALATISRIDVLTCYHDTAFTIQGRWREIPRAKALVNPCGWIRPAPCNPREEWLLYPYARISYQTDDGTEGEVDVSVPDELLGRLQEVPHDATFTATIAMDQPEARSCAVGDPGDGSPPLVVNRAVATCRVRYVLQDLSWNDGVLRTNSLAKVAVDRLRVQTEPGPDKNEAGRALRAGDHVYVAEGPRVVDGTDWYAVLWEDVNSVYGWVPAATKSRPTLVPHPVECPGMADWAAFYALGPWERLACFGGRPVSVDMWVRMTKPRLDTSLVCTYWKVKASAKVTGVPCLAQPEWLAGITGLQGRRPGDLEVRLSYDPATVDVASLGADTHWRRVTGSFMHPAADECRAVDQATGSDLVTPEEAGLYCDAVFVVTAIEPAAGPEPE